MIREKGELRRRKWKRQSLVATATARDGLFKE